MSGSVLVTGAGGFIGSHLVEALVEGGARVRAFVEYDALGRWGWLDTVDAAAHEQVEVIAGDVRDAMTVKQAMQGCHTVYHLAALIAIPYSYHAPASYVSTNVQGTLNVLQAARELEVAKVVHTSTSEVYGTAQVVPITEDHPLRAQSPYAASKIGADQMASAYHAAFGTPVAIIRPFNTYGPRQSIRAVIPTILTQLARGQRTLRLGALHPTRDFNHVDDTVHGFLAVAKAEETIGQVVNVGSGYEISIGELVALIADVMNVDVEIETDAARLRPERSEVERLVADASRIKRLTGWQPQYGGDRDRLAEGLRRTADWFTQAANLRHYPRGYGL